MKLLEKMSSLWLESLAQKYGYTHFKNKELVDKSVKHLVCILSDYINSDFSDPKFESQIMKANGSQYEQALGEMLFYDILVSNKFNLLPNSGEGPDFCVKKNDLKVWCELITPQSDDAGLIKKHHGNKDRYLNPSHQDSEMHDYELLMRITSALEVKQRKFILDKEKGIISDKDSCIIVINDALLCPSDISMFGVAFSADLGSTPMIVNATLSKKSLIKKNGSSIELSHFLNDKFPHISAIVQVTLRDDYGYSKELINLKGETVPRMLGILKKPDIVLNPYAINKIPYGFFNMKHWHHGSNGIEHRSLPIQVTQNDLVEYKKQMNMYLGIHQDS